MLPLGSGDVDEALAAERDEMLDDRLQRPRRLSRWIAGRARLPVARVDQHRRQCPRKRRGKLLLGQMRRHDDQAIDATSHRLKRKRRLAPLRVQVGQKQQISAAARLAVHAAHDLGKELAVKVGKNDPDRVCAREAEAARAGMRNVAELTDGLGDPRRASARLHCPDRSARATRSRPKLAPGERHRGSSLRPCVSLSAGDDAMRKVTAEPIAIA